MTNKPTVCILSYHGVSHNGRYAKVRRTLEANGWNVKTLILNATTTRVEEHTTYIQWPQWGRSFVPMLRSLAYKEQTARALNYLRSVGPTVFHPMDYISLDIAVKARRMFGGNLLFDACEIFTDTAHTSPKLTTYVNRIFQRASPHLDAVITPSAALKAHYSQNYPTWPEAEIVSNAPDINSVSPYDGRLHQTLNLRPDAKICLYHGGFSKQRGLEQLVKTAFHLPDGAVVVLMGWGALKDTLLDLIEQINHLSNRDVVHMLPAVPQDELIDWVSGAQYGLIPYETGPLNHELCTPNKLYEYPAAGVPVIATQLPVMSEIISKHQIGFTVPKVTGDTIAQLLNQTSRSDHQTLVKNCGTFSQKQSWQNDRDRLLIIYRSWRD